jgi:hypothetical protein
MRAIAAVGRVLGLAAVLAGCTTLHDLGVPTAQFDGIRFEQVEVSVASAAARLDVVLAFRVDNPSGTRLRVPRHAFAVRLGLPGQPAAPMTEVHAGTHGETPVPAGGHAVLEYTVPLSLDPAAANRALAYLGHEAVYEFQATVDLGPLNPPAGPPALTHRGRLRLPLPPRIVPDGPPTVTFVGGLERLDLRDLKRQMQPAVDAISSFGVAHVPGLGDAWSDFVAAFGQLDRVIRYPGPDTEGLSVTAPVRVLNPNDFPIELPAFALGARLPGAADPVLELHLTPGTGGTLTRAQRTIAGLQSKRLRAVATARWKDLGGGLARLLEPDGLESAQLSGSVSVDLGYGPVRITYP